MKLFKVIFENNKAILANQIDFSNRVTAEIEYPGGKSVLRWLILFAYDEQESILCATKIASEIGFKN